MSSQHALSRALGASALAVGALALSALVSCRVGAGHDKKQGMSNDSELAQVRIGLVDWYVDYDAALHLGMELQRPLWVHFGENPG